MEKDFLLRITDIQSTNLHDIWFVPSHYFFILSSVLIISMPPQDPPMTPPTHRVQLTGCERLHQALCECHRRIAAGPARDAACRHLNRSLAECMVALACPEESEAVRSLCSSGGTALKRSQCQQAQLSLAVCLSSHQWYSENPNPSFVPMWIIDLASLVIFLFQLSIQFDFIFIFQNWWNQCCLWGIAVSE